MSLESAASVAESPLPYVKELSGRRIEQARRRKRISQRQFARELGMGVRWLREIEGGNPKSRLEDHLRCAYQLDISTGHILIPLLFLSQRMSFPRQLFGSDFCDAERLCVEIVSRRNLAMLTTQLTPLWPPMLTSGAG